MYRDNGSGSSNSFGEADDASNHKAPRVGDRHRTPSSASESSPSGTSSSSLEDVGPSIMYPRRAHIRNTDHRHRTDYPRGPRPAVPYPVTPRERDMTIFRLKKQLFAASIFRSPSPSSHGSDTDSESSGSASTISEQSPVRHPRRTEFQRRGIDVWATPLTPERTTSSPEASSVEHRVVNHHVDVFRLPNASTNGLAPVATAGPSQVSSAAAFPSSRGTRRPHQPVVQARGAPRALPQERSYDSHRVDQRLSHPHRRPHHHDSQQHRVAQTQREPSGRGGSPYVVGVEIESHSEDAALRTTRADDGAALSNEGPVQGARGTVASQTDSSVQAALAVARTMLRKEHNTQTDPPVVSSHPVGMATKAASVAALAGPPLSSSQDPRRTQDRGLMTTPVVVVETSVSCEDATCQAVQLEPLRVNTACSTDVTVASTSTATDTPRVTTTATEATTTSASVAVETSTSSRACGTSTIDDSILLYRDRTPSPARIRAPQPTPKFHPYRSPGTSPSGRRRGFSPNAKALAALHTTRPPFTGPITALGRKTPPREHHHVNSTPGAYGSAVSSPDRAILTASELLSEDQQIALRCIKFVVFSDYSRNLDFRANIGFTLREARACYDAMTERGRTKWGFTGVYRSIAGSCGGSPRRYTAIDRLIHNAMTEVIRGACLDWNTWFAGVSRRRVEETLSRLTDHEDAFGYVVERNAEGSLVQLAKSRVQAVSPVLF